MYYYCNSCERSFIVQARYCFDCYYCQSCCVCNTPKFFNSRLEFYTPTRAQKKLNKSSRFISAEIEVAGIKNNKKLVEAVVRKWKGSIVYDGTLPRGGFEINTAPAAGDLYVRQVTDICAELARAGAVINNQCGLHVHVDARDYNYTDLGRLIKVYAAIEPALFLMVPPHRRNSIYSVKCGASLEKAVCSGKLTHLELKNNVCAVVYGTPNSVSYRKNKRGAGRGTGRYYALNLHSWFYRGTIECRLFDGTIDKNEIIDWGILWANILDFSLHSSDDEVSVSMSKEKSYESLIRIVKNNKRLKTFIDTRYNRYGKPKLITKTRSVGTTQLWHD